MKDFMGEEVTDSSIWVYKTHHPLIMGPPGKPNMNLRAICNKVISCVRNPYDSIASMVHMVIGQSGVISQKFSDPAIADDWDKIV